MVDDHGHNYLGTLGDVEAYAGSISWAVWFCLKRGNDG
jgi:hypothetical protein